MLSQGSKNPSQAGAFPVPTGSGVWESRGGVGAGMGQDRIRVPPAQKRGNVPAPPQELPCSASAADSRTLMDTRWTSPGFHQHCQAQLSSWGRPGAIQDILGNLCVYALPASSVHSSSRRNPLLPVLSAQRLLRGDPQVSLAISTLRALCPRPPFPWDQLLCPCSLPSLLCPHMEQTEM